MRPYYSNWKLFLMLLVQKELMKSNRYLLNSLGTNLRHFELYLHHLQIKKKKTFKRCLANSLAIDKESLTQLWRNTSHLWSIYGLSRYFKVNLHFGKYAMQLASSCCHGGFYVWLLLNSPNFHTNSKHSHVFRDTWHFPHDNATITWKWYLCMFLLPINLSIKWEARGHRVSHLG